MSSPRETVVFLHAHPDDEAIFTGGTLRLLHERQVRTVVVFATGGELGAVPSGSRADALAATRSGETGRAAEALGVDRVVTLRFGDSGMALDRAPEGSLARTPLEHVVGAVAEILADERASCVVSYDQHGIYGHPDHLVVFDAAREAAEQVGVASRYEATVDREHLHFVATHVVEDARRAGLGLASGTHDHFDLRRSGIDDASATSGYGTPTVLIDLAVDVTTVCDAKYRAMAAHVSQIPPESSALQLDRLAFANVYGTEWYLRNGPPSVLDDLPVR